MRIFLNDVLKQRNMSVRFKLQQKKGEDLRHFSLIFFLQMTYIYIHRITRISEVCWKPKLSPYGYEVLYYRLGKGGGRWVYNIHVGCV